VWANLDDPPIHIRPVVPASAGAEDKNPVGSGHYSILSIAPRGLNCNRFLCRKCQELGDKATTCLTQGGPGEAIPEIALNSVAN